MTGVQTCALPICTHTDLEVQAYFSYDSKKSGGYTVSNLRFGKSPIKSTYLINEADYVACHKDSYVRSFNVLEDIKENGIFVLNSSWSVTDMEKELPASLRRIIAQKHLQFYNIDATAIAKQQNLGSRINLIMETVFFKLTQLLPFSDAVTYLKQEAGKSYIRQGISVIEQNNRAIDATEAALIKIDYPAAWATAIDEEKVAESVPEFRSEERRVGKEC